MPEPSRVVVDSLTKIYKRSWREKKPILALDNLSLQIAPGEIFALLGPNGAGKSTFVKILLGMVFPTGGTATIVGHPVSNSHIRRWIGFLPEQAHFPATMTAQRILKLSGELYGLRGRELTRRLDYVFGTLGIETWKTTPMSKCSKGMIQRVAIALAILHDPILLLLDEPSDGLDPIGRREVRDLLKKFRDNGKTLLINSHLLSEVEMIADRVAVIHHGRIIRTGTLDDIAPPTGTYIVHLRSVLPQHLATALSNAIVSTSDGKTSIEASSSQQLDSVIRTLNDGQVSIDSIHPKRPTLEDAYVALINNELPE